MVSELRSFNLLYESWIPVMSHDWRYKEISLFELFENWKELREIKTENPPTTLAIYRFLLAILHWAYRGPNDVSHWKQIRDDAGKKVITSLKDKQDYFDLLHPVHPFMQDRILSNVNESVPIYVASVMHPAGKSTVFSHTHLWSGYSISFAEASRVLIRLQTCDVAGTRAQYPGKTGNRSGSAPPTINSANVIVLGSNLKETCLRNLIEYNPEEEYPRPFAGQDLPHWETGYTGQPQEKVTDAQGYIRYLTYPWRRTLLVRDKNKVSQIYITLGSSIRDEAKFSWDSGIAYANGKPIRLSSQKLLWRNVHAFLPPPAGSKEFSCPRVVDWVNKLYDNDLISDEIARLQIFGLCVNKDNAAEPEFWSCEQLSIPSIYLKEIGLWQQLQKVIEITESYQGVFSWRKNSPYHALAEVLKDSKKVEKFAKSLDGESRYWAALDREFQPLLVKLAADKTIDGNGTTYGNQVLPEWQKTVQDAARTAFTESIASIRNYQARAMALRSLDFQLRKLRGEDTGQSKKTKKSKTAA